MSDFNFYLNRQGVRGAKGSKGDKGDSPIISVAKQSANEFVLKVNNPDGTTIKSPNLVGQQIEVTASGDIVKYNRDTDAFYTSELDRATSDIEGIVRYATLADVDTREGGSVIGTDIFAQAISNVISSPDGSIIVGYNTENEETTLKIGGTLVTDVTDLKGRMTTAEGRIATLSTDMTNQAELLSMEVARSQAKDKEIENNVTSINNRLTTAEQEIVTTQGDVATLNADIATKQNKLVQGDNITLTENEDGTTTIAAAGGELPSNIVYTDTEQTITGSKIMNGASIYGSGDMSYSTLDTTYSLIKNGIYFDMFRRVIRISVNGRPLIKEVSGYTPNLISNADMHIDFQTANSNLILRYRDLQGNITTLGNVIHTGNVMNNIAVDGQTIQVVDGKLHANLDEINGEVSNVSTRVTSLEGQVGDVSAVLDSINGEVI